MAILEKTPLYLILIVFPCCLGVLFNFLFGKKQVDRGSRGAAIAIWIGFANLFIAWCTGLPFQKTVPFWGFAANEMSWLMGGLIVFVSGVVHHFSLRYMRGDRNCRRYFLFLSLITSTTLLMVAADHLFLFLFFWLCSNFILVFLMMHKSEWISAKNSAILAMKTFLLGFFFLSSAAIVLVFDAGTVSLDLIFQNKEALSGPAKLGALGFVILAAFTQSGGWPFHRWLLSSLNSPTPVSALMHAGLVNGGGFLLARFSPLFVDEPFVLNGLFGASLISLILGGIWQLMQTDVKRMLACSTMTQLGFMIMQCSLGLFPAALTHLCWHGLFKAFLFLRSGSAIGEARQKEGQTAASLPLFLLSSLCGFGGAAGFIFGARFSWKHLEGEAVLVFFCWIASTQMAHTLLKKKRSLSLLVTAIGVCLFGGIVYGLTVYGVEMSLAPMEISKPQDLHWIHIGAILLLFSIWAFFNLKLFSNREKFDGWKRFYLMAVNASLPDAKTIASSKDRYKF